MRLGEKKPGVYAAMLAIAAMFGMFFLCPLFLSIKTGFVYDGRLSLYWIGRTLGNPILMSKLANSFLLAGCTVITTTLVAMPLALLSARRAFAGRGVLSVLVLVPMILPPFVGALSIRRLLGQFGILTLCLERVGWLDLSRHVPPDWTGAGFAAVVVMQTLHLFPILFLNLTAALSNIDPAYTQAAQVFGAGGWQRFMRVVLPLMRPGLFAGAAIVFIWAFTDIGTPLVVGYENLASVVAFKELARAELSGRTFGLVFLLLGSSLLFYAVGKLVLGRPIAAESAKASVAAETKRLGLLGTMGAWGVFGGVIGLAVLPHIGVVLTALAETWVGTILPERLTLEHLQFVLTQPETRTCIVNSLRYAGTATALDIAVGTAAAWIIVRKKPWGGRLLDTLLMMPLAVPGIILAAGFIAMTVPGAMLEKIGPLGNPFWIIVIAYAVRRIPFMVRGVSAGLEQIPETLEQAACNLGASPLRAVFTITVPLIAANILAAAILTFAFAMLEVSDSLMLAQLRIHYPITKEIYGQAVSANPDAPHIAAALGVVGMTLLGGALATAGLLMGKRLGAIFRV